MCACVCEIERDSLDAFANQMCWAANCCCAALPVQLQLCMIPLWTSETMRLQLCLESWMERNITLTYMWGKKKCPALMFAELHFWCSLPVFIWQPLLIHRRIPLELIPEEEAECAAWIHKLYQEKVRAVWKQKFVGYSVPHRELFKRRGDPPTTSTGAEPKGQCWCL